ncbi:MAG: cyanoglobin [Planktomarina sp.]
MKYVISMKSMLDKLGGEIVLREVVETFYDLIESDPDCHALHRLHFRGHGLDHARQEQFNFLCGFLGGRQHYLEKHGHMNVKKIHAHIPIRTQDAEVWLRSFHKALLAVKVDPEVAERISDALHRVACMLINDIPDWR